MANNADRLLYRYYLAPYILSQNDRQQHNHRTGISFPTQSAPRTVTTAMIRNTHESVNYIPFSNYIQHMALKSQSNTVRGYHHSAWEDWVIIPVPGAGNCLFSSLSYALTSLSAFNPMTSHIPMIVASLRASNERVPVFSATHLRAQVALSLRDPSLINITQPYLTHSYQLLYNFRMNYVIERTEQELAQYRQALALDQDATNVIQDIQDQLFRKYHNQFMITDEHPDLAHIKPLLPPYRFVDYELAQFVDNDADTPEFTPNQIQQVSNLMLDNRVYWGDHFALRIFAALFPDLDVVVWSLSKSTSRNQPHILLKQCIDQSTSESGDNPTCTYNQQRPFTVNIFLTQDDSHYQLLGKHAINTDQIYTDDQLSNITYYAEDLQFIFLTQEENQYENTPALQRDLPQHETKFAYKPNSPAQNRSVNESTFSYDDGDRSSQESRYGRERPNPNRPRLRRNMNIPSATPSSSSLSSSSIGSNRQFSNDSNSSRYIFKQNR